MVIDPNADKNENDTESLNYIDHINMESSQDVIQYDPKDVQDRNSFQLVDISDLPITFRSRYSGELTSYTPPAQQHTIDTVQTDIRFNSTSRIVDVPRADDLNLSEEFLHSPENANGNMNLPRTIVKAGRNLLVSSRDDGSGDDIPQAQRNSNGNVNLPSTLAETVRNLPVSSQDDGSGEDISQARMQNANIKLSRTIAKAGRNLPVSSRDDAFTRENTTKNAPATSANANHGKTTRNTVEVAPVPSIPSNGQDDLLRRKLESCISSLSTKISEKHQRSPHAPFLAYLGTKLPNVPIEELPRLEKRILDLVDSFTR